MIDLSTDYLGRKLDNPLVPSSSPLTGNMDDAKRLQDAGASALILPSLFEEVVHYEQKQLENYVHFQALGHHEADSYGPVPEEYAGGLDNNLDTKQHRKNNLDITVHANVNGISINGNDVSPVNPYHVLENDVAAGKLINGNDVSVVQSRHVLVNKTAASITICGNVMLSATA